MLEKRVLLAMFDDSVKKKNDPTRYRCRSAQVWMYSTPAVGSKKGRTRIGQSFQREVLTLQWTRTTRPKGLAMYSNRQFGISKFRRGFGTECLLGGIANLPTAGLSGQQDSNLQSPSPMYSNHVSRNCVVNKK